MKVFIASANLGKIKEIQAILAGSAFQLLSVLDLPGFKNFDVEETGATFRDNALLKAKAYANLTSLPTMADDSGLEVEALDGFPSVNSNRWFEGSESERNLALLDLLKDKSSRRAKFCSVICFYDPVRQITEFFEGETAGTIASEPRGSKVEGFGYDPIFIPDGFTQTFAEMGVAFKNTISHRRKALFKLSQFALADKHLGQPE